MLEMRPNCECCDRDLSPATDAAYICSFECTWCADCVRSFPGGACPNCGGSLQLRPTRAPHKLAGAPASTTRVLSPGCRETAAPGSVLGGVPA
ncbi:DUF1272 domain-containing protein [Cryobacterium sp. 1639]|uniref:DUF1272 domain-containing protein n=1 Tax=Cryobacterium inferilacus TaxID=2866629 RepID=UPI001C736D39|nr:DUF1272 domain-containing protein [Cryobacterium sp. 1639]MBX0300369.1 DUF1272 domain-containing protein [Cryobacterium sp. 1639]